MSAPIAILIVEDDENLRVTLRDNLEQEGFAIEAVADGPAALEQATARPFDVILLDVMLPGVDGYQVCRALRGAGCEAKILMLTARTLEEDIVGGLDAGADDYLVKPYRLRELLARVRALSRRGAAAARSAAPHQPPELLRCGAFRIDCARRDVTDEAGASVKLTRTEFDLLVYLVRNRGRALSRNDLLQQVWQGMVLDERTVDNFVSSLKKKLRWGAGAGFEIHTVRGVGYRFE
jgi:DNA-binding response OmpR family regulator